MKIKDIALPLYRSGEYVQFLVDSISIVGANAIALPDVLPIIADLHTNSQILSRDLNPHHKKPLTAELAALDRCRDNSIQGIAHTANTYHYTPATADAARVLLHQLQLYRANVAYQDRMAESALIRDSAKPKLATAIAQPALSPWITELEAANATCAIQRIKAIAAIQKVAVKPLCGQCVQQHRQLCNLLQAHYIITSGADPYSTYILQLNALIKQY